MPEEAGSEEGEAGGSGLGELGAADHHADLFSEVHLHEISRLEKQLEQAHNENVSHYALNDFIMVSIPKSLYDYLSIKW